MSKHLKIFNAFIAVSVQSEGLAFSVFKKFKWMIAEEVAWMAGLVSQNISTVMKWVAIKFGTDLHVPQRMICKYGMP